MGEVCVAGACKGQETTLLVAVREEVTATSDSPTVKKPTLTVCSYDTGAMALPVEPLFGCARVTVDPTPDLPPWGGDLGPLSVSGASFGAVALAPSTSAAYPCEGLDATPLEALVPGEVMTFSAAGSAVFPALSHAAPVPEAVTILTSGYGLGAPLELAWTGSSGGFVRVIFMTFSDDPTSPFISCRLPDTGSFTVPASLTAELAPSVVGAYLSITRVVESEALADGAPTALRARFEVSDARVFVGP